MLDPRRFAIAVLAGLLPLFGLLVNTARTPEGAAALAGDVNSPAFRLSLEDFSIRGIKFSGQTVDGENVAKLDLGSINNGSNLVIERDFDSSNLIPGGPVYTFSLKIPTLNQTNIDVYGKKTCMSGIGITRLGFFRGLFDRSINRSLSSGFSGNFVTGLVNLIGPSGLISFTVRDFDSEVVRLDAGRTIGTRFPSIVVGPQRTDPAFSGSCL